MRKKEEAAVETTTVSQEIVEPTIEQLKVADYDLIMEIERMTMLRRQIRAKMQEILSKGN